MFILPTNTISHISIENQCQNKEANDIFHQLNHNIYLQLQQSTQHDVHRLASNDNTSFFNMPQFSQTCIKRSSLGQRKNGLIRQVTSLKRLNSYEIFYDRTTKMWPFNTGDCLIDATTLAGMQKGGLLIQVTA